MLVKLIAQYLSDGGRDNSLRDEEMYNIKAVDVAAHLINHFDRGAVIVTILPMERTV